MNIAANLDKVFGPGEGITPDERARRSRRMFVRSMDGIAEDSPRATGRRLTAQEALEAYGFDVLLEVANEGSALLCESPSSAARLLRSRRELLNLTLRDVARAADVHISLLEAAESSKRVPIRSLERLARVLGLDERMISWRTTPAPGNNDLAVRLRTLGDDKPFMSSSATGAIAEAAWVATTQLRLQRSLHIQPEWPGDITASPNYGEPGYPAYKHGYWLALKAREALHLGEGPLTVSLRELAEDGLGIPIIQSELGPEIAGVTVEVAQNAEQSSHDRAIVLNLEGGNRNVFVRRSTLAHELGHLLFDPPQRLQQLRADDYDDLERSPHELADPVEQRANAFAIEFIAPQAYVLQQYERAREDGIRSVMDQFGVSFTAARYQIWNGLDREIQLNDLKYPTTRPDNRWDALEAYTVDYHPIRRIRSSRAGRFSAVVTRAASVGIISWDTATEMLGAGDEAEVKAAEPWLRELFPRVFE